MKKITLSLCIVCLSVFICSCLLDIIGISDGIYNEIRINQLKKQQSSAAIQPVPDTAYPTGEYTGKYIMDSDRGEGSILINHYTNDLIFYSLNIDAAKGIPSISNGRLKLGEILQ